MKYRQSTKTKDDERKKGGVRRVTNQTQKEQEMNVLYSSTMWQNVNKEYR